MRLFILIMCCLFLIIGANAQTKDTIATEKTYELSNSSSISNCQIYAVKMLQAVTHETDTNVQLQYLNDANAYRELSSYGAEC